MIDREPILDDVVRELAGEHAAHTIVLYGSRANGTHRLDSDYDIAAFAPRTGALRIARTAGASFLDVFVYPDDALSTPTPEHFKLLDGQVLTDDAGQARTFLRKVRELHDKGPEPLGADEVQMRKVWAHKMVARAAHDDPEANYRRVWLLTALIEDHFAISRRWYEGPKVALSWLLANEPDLYEAYARALRPDAQLEDIRALVLAAYGPLA